MADSTPLLSQSSSIETTKEAAMQRSFSPQLLQSTIVAAAWFFDSQQTFISAITDAYPKWKCLDPVDPICQSASRPCGLQPGSWAWDSADTSIVSEWDLECTDTIIVSLPASAFFVGCTVGALFFSGLADSVLGRKLLLVLSCLVMSLCGVMTIFSPNIWVYSLLKLGSGLGRASIASSALVLSMEIAEKWWRNNISTLGFAFFMLGFLTLPVIAYNFGDGLSWRSMYIWTNIPSLFYTILLFWFVQESPRWLKVHKENQDDLIQKDVPQYTRYDFYSSLRMLYANKQILWRLAAVMTANIGIGFSYFGLPFTLGELNFNLFFSVALNALSELPACLLSWLLVAKLDRKTSILVLSALSSVCSLACTFDVVGIAKRIQLVAEVISFCLACTASNIVLIYCVELFPTTVRNTAISLARVATLLGGAFAPVMAAEGQSSRVWSFGFFGLAIGFCSLPFAFVPETKGRDLIDHIGDEERREEESYI